MEECMKRILIGFVLCAVLLSGSWNVIAETTDPAAVVAKVNDEEILQSEIDLFMNSLVLPQMQAKNQGKELSPEQKQQVEQDIINQLINQRLLLKIASDLNITVDQEVANERFEAAKMQYQNIAPEKLKQIMEDELLLDKTIRHIQQEKASEITVSDEEARNVYEEQKKQMMAQIVSQISALQQKLNDSTDEEERKVLENQLKVLEEQQAAGPLSEPEQVRASHILATTEEVAADATQEEKDAAKEKNEAARKKIEDILKQVKEGKDFAELAIELSDGPSKERSGDLGFFARGSMIKPFEDVAFALSVGEVSDIVETQFGYHIIKVTDKKSKREVPFEELKDRIIQMISQQKANAEMSAWFGNLHSNAKIEIMKQTE